MAKLKDKVKNALDESRMLVLGAQVLVGFQMRSVFEKGFESLPIISQALKLCGLGLMLLAVGLIIAPSSYHRLVERGEDTHEIHRYTSKMMDWALLPFAFGLGIDLYVATQKIAGSWKLGVVAGLFGALAAGFFWYGLEFYMRRERAGEIEEKMRESEMEESQAQDGGKNSKLTDKIQ